MLEMLLHPKRHVGPTSLPKPLPCFRAIIKRLTGKGFLPVGFLSAFLGSLLVFNLQVNFGDVCIELGKNWFPGRHRASGGGGVARRTRRHRASQLRRPDGGRRMQAGS